MSDLAPSLKKISIDLTKIEDANSNIDVLLRAIGYISELSAGRAHKALEDKVFSEGYAFSAASALELIMGLQCIASDEVTRSAEARLAADNALFALTKVQA